jgi:glycosyltransferase involved in cell wall biosynthesis
MMPYMEKYNVCLVNDSFPPEIDGVANAVTNYAQIINKKLGSATVVTPYHPEADDSVFLFQVCRYPSLNTTKLVGYRAGLPFSPDVQRVLENDGFDIIHSHCPITSTMLARLLRERIDAPLVLTYHTKFDIDIANAIHSKLLQEEAKHMLVENISACDEVWTVSRGAGENLRSLGYEGDYIVMPNGVDFPQGRVEERLIEEVTADYDLPTDVPMFLFVGRMMWYKGIRIILDALKKLDEDGQNFRMVFVGGGADRDEIVTYSESLGLNEKVFFCPAIHDRNLIRAWYCRADLFLFPSTFDTNGLVVREAAACGLASVLIGGSCAAEDVMENVSGFLIEENSDSMAAKLTELCANRETMKRVGQAAQRDIYISWEDAVTNAYRRYGVVLDNYRSGVYPEHERMSDDFIRKMAQGMEKWDSRSAKQKAKFNTFKQEYRELKMDVSSKRRQLKQNITDRFL